MNIVKNINIEGISNSSYIELSNMELEKLILKNGLIDTISIFNVNNNNNNNNKIVEILEELGYEVRLCTNCNKVMLKGYCIGEGDHYACSDECLEMLKLKFSDYDYKNIDDCYYTEWEE